MLLTNGTVATRGAEPLTVVDIASETRTLAPGMASRIVAQANENCAKVSVFAGEGSWHAHTETDEMFVVLEGELLLDVFEGETIAVLPGQIVTIPARTVHRPRANVRSVLLCFKPVVSRTEFYELATTE